MIPKTEPAEHIPKSTLPLSMDSIVKDLRSLEKSFISSRERGQNQLNIMQANVKRLELEDSKSKTELKDMKSKIKLLEEENSKLKSDLEESDMHKRELAAEKICLIGKNDELKKEVQELKMRNESSETKMVLLKSTKLDDIKSVSDESSDEDLSSEESFEDQIEEILDRKVIG